MKRSEERELKLGAPPSFRLPAFDDLPDGLVGCGLRHRFAHFRCRFGDSIRTKIYIIHNRLQIRAN